MNQKQLQEIVNTNVREYLDRSIKYLPNVIRFNATNSKVHEMKKAELCYHLLQSGFTFVTEHPLKNGKGRPDILLLDVIPPIAYEVVASESDESILLKGEKWNPIRIIKVSVYD